jgi:uncharacterized protein with NAD-binding domain and iron-sulfur cluster
MGALAAALELTEGDWRSRLGSVTVYQRGWRLGGKGASSRGIHGRIEEHGLHVLLGYYDQTFRLMRRCYDELDRSRTDPACPIRTWDDAVRPSHDVGVMDRDGGRWQPWVASFAPNAARPGDVVEPGPLSAPELVARSLQLLTDFNRSLADETRPAGRVELSASSRPRPVPPPGGLDEVALALRGASLAALATLVKAAEVVGDPGTMDDARADGGRAAAAQVQSALGPVVRALRDGVSDALRQRPEGRRTLALVDLVLTNLRGIAADGLLTAERGLATVDDQDYRDWLSAHGAAKETLESPLLRGLYDLVFAYEDGDPRRPRFSAGLGLQLATRMFLDYKGAIFWHMQAGMGEVIFAPIYEVLRRRGVRFCFFHRVDRLGLSEDGRRVDSVRLTRQVDLAAGRDDYEPLVTVKGLPCWPPAPLAAQLGHLREPAAVLESHQGAGAASVELHDGWDFDAVVFGLSVGMVPLVAEELVERHQRWRDMVEHLGTVSTQSFQVWLRDDQRALGWRGPERVTVSGYVEPFDTWASMGHLIDREDWPLAGRPGAIAYFCNTMGGRAVTDLIEAAAHDQEVADRAVTFLRRDLPALLPGARDPATGDFRWSLLCDGVPPRDDVGPEAFTTQYWRANTDPSDRYVQSLPGTDRYRLAPGASGIDNLYLAGDWTDCGLNAGCVEAAARSGVQAAHALAARMVPSHG